MRYRALIVAFCALCLMAVTSFGGSALAAVKGDGLTYDDIVGTGLANTCPQLRETVRGSIPLDKGKSYVIKELCLEPSDYAVKEEGTNKRAEAKFVKGKIMTRKTSTLEQITGPLDFNSDGTLTFTEKEGIDFQAITVLMPNKELVPFLFTTKSFVAKTDDPVSSINTSTTFSGGYRVPSYRTSNFLDPKGRGLTTGYQSAMSKPASGDSEEIAKENTKRFVVGSGKMTLLVSKVDGASGEIGGIFEAIQPSDTDMGGKEPLDVRVRGLFYALVEEA
jgi:photosystem II oxygen-evolving enhancer protein 1